ncbi:MAG TPA: PH domain-containing protein [Nitrososphaerales archaeon]|nr:PH domain-containing protein [Nitrososphaerales archaeon]
MSPAGSTSSVQAEKGRALVLRPAVSKTFLKGLIAIGAFSIFLQINPATFTNYLIFLALSVGLVSVVVALKHQTKIEIGDESLTVKRLFRPKSIVRYLDILDISVSQGMLARRFDCGTVFMLLKSGGGGSVHVMGGGVAEQLEDVPKPKYISDLISSKLSPFAGGPEDLS